MLDCPSIVRQGGKHIVAGNFSGGIRRPRRSVPALLFAARAEVCPQAGIEDCD